MDDYISSIQVGASTISVILLGSSTLSDFSVTVPAFGSLFQVGSNTLSFVVHNFGNVTTGLYANVSINATCGAGTVSATTMTFAFSVPALGTTALTLLASLLLLGDGAAVRRRVR